MMMFTVNLLQPTTEMEVWLVNFSFTFKRTGTVDWNYFALENICKNGRELGWENFCDQNLLQKFITTIITI